KKGHVENKIIMPDLTGYTLERVDEALNKIGISYSATGTGRVTTQSVEAGHALEKGAKVQLTLEEIKH
ncbi:MAG: PASTA domain-containing protein, partial [Clostridium sp.]